MAARDPSNDVLVRRAATEGRPYNNARVILNARKWYGPASRRTVVIRRLEIDPH